MCGETANVRATSGTGPCVFAHGARLEKLAGGFEFTEGPTCDAAGNIFFTDQPSNRILTWSAEGELSTFLHPAGRANGMYFDPRGHLIACADEGNALWSIAPDGTVSVIVAEYGGKLLNGPNDVWVRSDGAIYFTDPFYQRSWWTHDTMPQDGQHVYFLSAERRRLVRVADDLEKPNGITLTFSEEQIRCSSTSSLFWIALMAIMRLLRLARNRSTFLYKAVRTCPK